MATMNISLPDDMRKWVESQLAEGKYSSSSDYVRDLIRRHQENIEGINLLQSAISDGLNSGSAEAFDPAEFKRELKAKYIER